MQTICNLLKHKDMSNLEKLTAIAVSRPKAISEKANWRRANRNWLRMSQEIALCVHYYLRKKGMTQKRLADAMNVSPTYIGKLLKGNENLTLETICKIQEAIGAEIASVSRPYECTGVISPSRHFPITSMDREFKFEVIKTAVSGYASIEHAA